MLANDEIIKIALRIQTTEQNIRREYFQHLFLSLFYKQEGMDKVYFKGGTALRLVYNSPRFSEDLDFDSPLADVAEIENAIISALAEAERDGIKTELEETKQTTGGYLSIMRFSALGHIVPIRIEISFRDRTKEGAAANITSDLFPDYAIMQLDQKQLVQGKLKALFDRRKPRDLYDFYFLLRHNMLPDEKKEILEQTRTILEAYTQSFDGLKEFLPKSHHIIVKDFKATLEREMKRYK